MVLGWFKGSASKEESIDDLVARKDYSKAIEQLKVHLKASPKDVRLRQQLADVYVAADRVADGVEILARLADEFASDGFVAKSIAVLKKMQKIDPRRHDIDEKLASLIDGKDKDVSTGKFHLSSSGEVSLSEEIGSEELGIELAPDDLPAEAQAPAEPTKAEPPPPPPASPAVSSAEAPKEVGEETTTEHIGDSTAIRRRKSEERRWREIATTPLFTDFTRDELVAVIRGMKLRTFEDGDIIVTEHEPGDSLFVITTGKVKVFTMNPQGQHLQLAELSDGDFFGEVSVLTGKPRTATITAATKCEVLELSKATLDGITAGHPRVRTVLEDFYKLRVDKTVEAMISSLRK